MDEQQAAAMFAEHRTYLIGVAYRVLGMVSDAEDVVADAWPRWREHAADVTTPRAWLTTVVARLALDHLRSARVQRERYVGPWLPEPVVTAVGQPLRAAPEDPLARLVREEEVRFALLVILETLTPEQRVAVVLHDVLGVPFAAVADVLGCEVATARQHALRGRRRMADAGDPPAAAPAETARVLADLATALRNGDVDAVAAALAPDVVLLSDGGGDVAAPRSPLLGRMQVTRFLVALGTGHPGQYELQPVLVNGQPGTVVWLHAAKPREPTVTVLLIEVGPAGVHRLLSVAAPAKLTRLPTTG